MGRLRVALYHFLPPGGAARAMVELVRRSADDVEHVVFEIDTGPRDRHADRPGPFDGVDVQVHRTTVPGGPPHRLGDWTVTVPRLLAAERRLARRLAAGDFDALVVHPHRYTQAPSLLLHPGPPSLYFAHEPRRQSFEYELRPHRGRRPPAALAAHLVDGLVRRLDTAAARAATTLCCNSHHTREYLWRAYGRDATVVPLGVDLDLFTPGPSPGTDSGSRPEVLVVAALERPKAIDLAIGALALLPAERRPVLRIVHNRVDPGHRDELLALAARTGVDLVLEHDIGDRDLVERYRRARACLLTARLEPLGLTALEALACGTPVVAVREGGYRETIDHGRTGLLVDRHPRALAEGLARVLDGELGTDPAELHRQVATTRGWDAAVAAYVGALDATVAAGTRSGTVPTERRAHTAK